MGGLSSALAPIIQIGSALGTVANVIQPFYAESIAGKQKKQEDALRFQQAQQSASLQKQINESQAQLTENERRTKLKRAMSRQRAVSGGSGIGSADGSSEAVLLGLFNESEQERVKREQLENLRNSALDQNALQGNQLNLLEQAQLQEKQNLEQLSRTYRVLADT